MKCRNLILISLVVSLLFLDKAEASYCLRELTNGNLRVLDVDVDNCATGYILFDDSDFETLNADVLLLKNELNNLELPTALDIASSFTWGFGTYISFWYIGHCIRVARMTIRKM